MIFDQLVENRKGFLGQLINTLENQFQIQDELYKEFSETFKDKRELSLKISEELDNNTDYIQRIFIDSPWGSGKSYFGNVLEEILNQKGIKTLKINAWETDYFSDPMKSIIGEISVNLIQENEAVEKMKNYYNAAKNLTSSEGIKVVSKVAKEIGKGILKNKLGLKDDTLKEIEGFFSDINLEYEKIEKEAEIELLNEYKNYKLMVEKFKKELNENINRKVIIIDELDRCKPQYAIELLETIKHMFGTRNLMFVFLINKEQLSKTVSNMYIGSDERGEYFEKFYDVFFSLPEIDFEQYIKMEYEKYEKIETYECINKDGYLFSKKNNLIMEKLFLDMVSSNKGLLRANSVRHLKKIFGKYKTLINSLSEEEMKNLSLMLILTTHFIKKEYIEAFSEENKYRKNYETVYFKGFLLETLFLKNENREEFKSQYQYLTYLKGIIKGAIQYSSVNGITLSAPFIQKIQNATIEFSDLKYGEITIKDRKKAILPDIIKCVDKSNINSFEILKWCEDKISFVKEL